MVSVSLSRLSIKKPYGIARNAAELYSSASFYRHPVARNETVMTSSAYLVALKTQTA